MKSKNELEMEDERKKGRILKKQADCWLQGIFMVIQQHL